MMDMVVRDQVVFDAGSVGVPTPAQRDARVGMVTDQIVLNVCTSRHPYPNCDSTEILLSATFDQVVADTVIGGGLLRGTRPIFADHQAVATDVNKGIAFDSIFATVAT